MKKSLLLFALFFVLAFSQTQRLNKPHSNPKPVTLDGQFTPSFNYYPSAKIVFSGNQVKLTGVCSNNIHGQYQMDSAGNIKFDTLTGQQRDCPVNYDAFYISALKNSVSYQIESDKIIFKNNNKKLTIFLVKAKQPTGTPVSLAGKYKTQIPGFVVEFTDVQVKLIGQCTLSSNYKAYSDGSLSVDSFSGDFSKCYQDKYEIYAINLSQTDRFEVNKDGSITFKKPNGEITAKLRPANDNDKKAQQVDKKGQYVSEKAADKCAQVKCSAGLACKDGQCVRASSAEINKNSNSCLNIKCSPGARCDNGKCVPDIQNLRFDNNQRFSAQNQVGFGSFGQGNQNNFGQFNQQFNQNGFGQFNQNGFNQYTQNQRYNV